MMMRVMKYILDTKNMGLSLSVSGYIGDKQARLSVTGFMILINGILVLWKPKGQRMVALSSTEAEYVAFGEAVKEELYIIQVLTLMGVEIDLPVKVHVDNFRAVYLEKWAVLERGLSICKLGTIVSDNI